MHNLKKPRTSLTSPRKAAYKSQKGRCYYCNTPMWEGEESAPKFAQKHGLKAGRLRLLRCTGEHLLAHSDGGVASRKNIVAACDFCNTHRHRPKTPLSPSKYKKHVEKRISKGAWHQMYNLCVNLHPKLTHVLHTKLTPKNRGNY